MAHYNNITLDLNILCHQQVDLRIPSAMNLKEMLQIVLESYKIDARLLNPTARIMQTGEVLASTTVLNTVKNGMLLKLETL